MANFAFGMCFLHSKVKRRVPQVWGILNFEGGDFEVTSIISHVSHVSHVTSHVFIDVLSFCVLFLSFVLGVWLVLTAPIRVLSGLGSSRAEAASNVVFPHHTALFVQG